MIDCHNLHCHVMDIFAYNTQVNKFIFDLKINPNSYFLINSKSLYGLFCNSCNLFYHDYKSEYKLNDIVVSLFTKERALWNSKLKISEFYQFSDFCLNGAKDEINAYISQKNKNLEIESNELNQKINNL